MECSDKNRIIPTTQYIDLVNKTINDQQEAIKQLWNKIHSMENEIILLKECITPTRYPMMIQEEHKEEQKEKEREDIYNIGCFEDSEDSFPDFIENSDYFSF